MRLFWRSWCRLFGHRRRRRFTPVTVANHNWPWPEQDALVCPRCGDRKSVKPRAAKPSQP